jgi:hypothetical protein
LELDEHGRKLLDVDLHGLGNVHAGSVTSNPKKGPASRRDAGP